MKIKKNLLDVSKDYIDLNNHFKNSTRNIIRDLLDKIIRKNFYKIIYKNFFINQKYKFDLVLPSKGFSPLSRKKKLDSLKSIKNKKILLLGCGDGLDVISWLRFKPKYIEGVDLLNYSSSWLKIKKFIKKKQSYTKVKLYQKDILKLKTSKKFDFIISDAVFEHLTKLDKTMKHLCKMLKKDGMIYSSYGPLWYCFGGDHFSGRDNLKNGFNHIILKKKNYKEYVNKNIKSLKEEIKNFGAGGLFVKKNLFSKKTGNTYMKIFKNNNLFSVYTVLEFCPIGLELIINDKRLLNKILLKNKKIDMEDCYLKSQIVYLKKNE